MLDRVRTCLGFLAILFLTVLLSGQTSGIQDIRVIVKFAEPPVLRQALGQMPESARSGLNGRRMREFLAGRTAQAYRLELEQSQGQKLEQLQAAVPGLRAGHRYQYAFNGASVTVKASQVADISRQPGILAVYPSISLQPEDEYSEQVTEIPAAWTRLAQEYGKSRPGEGMRIALIDTGVVISHPSFNDAGFAAPPGFPVSETVANGIRTPIPAGSTNNKVIVANVYIPAGSSSYSRVVSDVHGSMVAATAAGVPVKLDDPSQSVMMQGVAPYAYLLNLMAVGGAPEYLAAVDDAARYGADVLNISQGTTAWLVWAEGRNPIQEALDGLADAGVVVCLSAGNAGGNGPGTISATFKFSDQVLVVGNQMSRRPSSASGKLSAVAPAAAAGNTALKDLELVSSYPFRAGFRAPLVPTAVVQDSRGHINDEYSRKALYPFPPGSLAGKIALAERGSVTTDLSATFATKWTNVKAGGAVALIVYNSFSPGDPAYSPIGPIFTLDPYAVMERAGGLSLDEAARNYTPALEIEIARSNTISDPGNSIAPSSSRGPTPRLRIKPDVVVPATNVLLPAFTVSGSNYLPNGFALVNGTSFASPLVAGAAALLQQAHPDWSSRQVRAALVTTVDTQVAPTQAEVNIMAQGAGSVRVDRALHPALHISPSTLSLGALAIGQRRTAMIQVEDTRPVSDTSSRTYKMDIVPISAGPSIQPEASFLNLHGGGQGYFRIAFSVDDLSSGDYSGHLVISGPAGNSQAVPYFVRVPAAPAADVLLVLWRDDSFTTSYRQRYESMLAQAGLGFDVLEMRRGDAMPTLQRLQRYRLVMLATGDVSNPFIASLAGGSFPWQGYLLAGGRLLIAGHAFNSRPSSTTNIQNQGADYLLSAHGAGYIPVTNNPISAGAARATIRLGGLLGDVDISSGTDGDGAGNQKGVDLGRLVTPSDISNIDNAAELSPHIRKLLAATEISVDGMHWAIPTSGDTVATGVWPDTNLDRPNAGVSWAAAFLSFGLEGVNNSSGYVSGSELLRRLYRWLVDDIGVRLDVRDLAPGKTSTLRAVASTTLSGNSAERFRWDFGDGSSVVTGTASEVNHAYAAWPSKPPRVEVTDSVGHTVVSQASLYLPFLSPAEGWSIELRVLNTGSQPVVPVFLAFSDAGLELARRGDRSILPGGCLTMNMAELFPSIAPGLIQHVRIDSGAGLEALAVITSTDGEEMTSIPGQHWAQPQLYIPHISQAVDQYYTRYAVIRTTESAEEVRFEGNGSSRLLGLTTSSDSQQRRTFADLFGGTLPPALEWGRFFSEKGSSILAGAELFGRVDGPRQLAAMPLDGNSGRTLSFVHVSSDSDLFWTGMVYANVGTSPARVTVKSYNAGGQERAGATHMLAPGAKQVLLYDRKVTTTVPSIALDFSNDVAWVQAQSDGSLIGYELFGTVDDSRLEGLTAPSAGSRRLLFPYVSYLPGTWTGIAVVNLSSTPATARLKALDPAGRVLATVSRSYAPYAKDLGLIAQLFGGKLPAGTTYLLLEADALLWGFELFGDDAGRRMGGANAFPLP